PRTFDELGGEVVQNTAYVVANRAPQENESGTYFRLVDGKDCSDKERMFLSALLNKMEHTYYPSVSQNVFNKIPGCAIGYWLSDTFISVLKAKNLGEVAHPRRTIQCGDVERFIKLWHEVGYNNIEKSDDINLLRRGSSCKWNKFSNGGSKRRWYGNLDSVLLWKNNGLTIKNTGKAIVPNENLYFEKCVGYGRITSNGLSAREFKQGLLLGDATSMIVAHENHYEILALLNTKVSQYAMEFFNPSLAAQTGSVSLIPIVRLKNGDCIAENVQQNISISKADWDAHETSWDFQKNELLAMTLEDEDANVQFDIDEAAKCGKMLCIDRAAPEPESLSWRRRVYQGKWERLFKQLHANEEELNRQFIEIYGLQDELTPEVPLDEVTILQQGEISVGKPADCNMSCDAPLVDYEQIEWHEDVVIKQFISYAVGCIMGRYRLDKPGLAIAHPNAAAEEKAPYQYKGETIAMDNDGIIPLMTKDSAFSDNAVNRFTEFLRVSLGAESLTENLNFVEKSLGKTVEDYLAKDFWTDHKKMYQNKPIYWLFSSKKGAFKCITYMHRMDAYTAELVRKNYLLKHIDYLAGKIAGLEQDEANLSSGDRKKLASYRKDYAECIEYDERLQLVASKQIAFDLDDGVVVNYAKFGDVLAKIK
ncbi:MAG: BREX-1 system adenine-specific DNA-methyltransferase PglX, partial [Treponema sp.]|nr:BREX-1 system adenine-specific DNA-methyltransferase PglX [Treponema sp.]